MASPPQPRAGETQGQSTPTPGQATQAPGCCNPGPGHPTPGRCNSRARPPQPRAGATQGRCTPIPGQATPTPGATAEPQTPFPPARGLGRQPRPPAEPQLPAALKTPGPPPAAASLAPTAGPGQSRGFPPAVYTPWDFPTLANAATRFLLQISAASLEPAPPLGRQRITLLPRPIQAARRLRSAGWNPSAQVEGARRRSALSASSAGGRGRSSSSEEASAVSVRGRCALGTGRRWLAPWLRLLSRRRLLLPVARAAGRSGVLVSDAAEV